MIYDRRSNLEAEQKGKGTEDAPESLTIIPNSEVLETGTLAWEGPMCVCVHPHIRLSGRTKCSKIPVWQ